MWRGWGSEVEREGKERREGKGRKEGKRATVSGEVVCCCDGRGENDPGGGGGGGDGGGGGGSGENVEVSEKSIRRKDVCFI